MIHERYRRDYDGEFILLETTIRDNQIHQQREWVPNAIVNDHVSGRAAVIGDRFRFGNFTARRLQDHRGGLLASKSLQTYGTADLWQDLRFDFFYTQDDATAQTLHESGYAENTVVYTTTRLCCEYPGSFYPVPYQPVLDQLAQILYLAAFDGHREIFMLGYHAGLAAGTRNWIANVAEVLRTYAGTRFYVVGASDVPRVWLENENVSTMDYRRFVSYCDI